MCNGSYQLTTSVHCFVTVQVVATGEGFDGGDPGAMASSNDLNVLLFAQHFRQDFYRLMETFIAEE